jgi:phosphoglycolate phosphatase
MAMRLRAVIFDFDFTLVDSSKGFIDCYDYACRELSLPSMSPLESMAMMGTPLPDAFRLQFDEQYAGLSDRFIALWQARADEVMTDMTAMFPDTPAMLAALKEQGLALGMVSQKFRRRIEAVLERDDLTRWFDVVIGSEDLSSFKPDPEGLLKACESLKVAPGEAIYAGDTVIDGQAAANAGMPFVAVLSGVTPREAFDAIPKLAVLEGVGGLPDLCRSLSS